MTEEEPRDLYELNCAAFDELMRLARFAKHSRANPVLSTRTLINEAWVRMASAGKFKPESRQHYMNTAAKIMRQVMTEAARRRSADKRGGGELSLFVALDENTLPIASGRDVLALDDALNRLACLNPRQAKIVEEKFFGGFEMEEIAANLGISVKTAGRDWRFAKAWLAKELRTGG